MIKIPVKYKFRHHKIQERLMWLEILRNFLNMLRHISWHHFYTKLFLPLAASEDIDSKMPLQKCNTPVSRFNTYLDVKYWLDQEWVNLIWLCIHYRDCVYIVGFGENVKHLNMREGEKRWDERSRMKGIVPTSISYWWGGKTYSEDALKWTRWEEPQPESCCQVIEPQLGSPSAS